MRFGRWPWEVVKTSGTRTDLDAGHEADSGLSPNGSPALSLRHHHPHIVDAMSRQRARAPSTMYCGRGRASLHSGPSLQAFDPSHSEQHGIH